MYSLLSMPHWRHFFPAQKKATPVPHLSLQTCKVGRGVNAWIDASPPERATC
jgi:hypothetical protein